MWSTPAPPSTALVASSIWSGVGEVKTSPGQAASSIPAPTKPPCIGSWPEPPPDMTPTLPCTGPSAGALMSFFMPLQSPWSERPASVVGADPTDGPVGGSMLQEDQDRVVPKPTH